MKERLYEISQIIEEYFKGVVWNSKPPLKETDYKLLMLGINIAKFAEDTENINDLNIKISSIMRNIEKDFKMPLLEQGVNDFIKQDEHINKMLAIIYIKLYALRSL